MAKEALLFKFLDSTTLAGKTGLTVTANVRRMARSDGAVTTVATAAACVEVGDGVYLYSLTDPDYVTYSGYIATAIPSVTTGLSNKDADAFSADYSVSSLKPTTAGRTLDVSAGGEAGLDWANVGSPTTTIVLSGTTVGTVTLVGTLTNLPTAPTDWITAAALKADAVTEIQSGLMLTSGYTAPDNAGVTAANTALTTIAGYLDTEIAAIKAKTDNLPVDPADQSLIIAATDAVMARIGVAGAGLTALGDTRLANLDVVLSTRAAAANLATANASLVKIQAATYDSATASGDTITLSNAATQAISASGRVTT